MLTTCLFKDGRKSRCDKKALDQLYVSKSSRSFLDKKISIAFDHVSLPEALQMLSREVGYNVSYSKRKLGKHQTIIGRYRYVAFHKILTDLLGKQPWQVNIDYRFHQ